MYRIGKVAARTGVSADALGVLAMAAIAVNGELRLPALPTVDRFRAILSSAG
jgi:hypothetical protein